MEKIKASDRNAARVFFALWPAQEMQDELHKVALSFGSKCHGLVSRKNTLHMTLFFIGSIEREKLPKLIKTAGKVVAPSFMLEINQFSCWRHNGIGYAAPWRTPEGLDQLVGKLVHEVCAENALVDSGEFSPHVTLLRKIGHFIETQDIPLIPWRINSFELVESIPSKHGRNYSVLKSWPLVSEGARGTPSSLRPA